MQKFVIIYKKTSVFLELTKRRNYDILTLARMLIVYAID